MMTSTYPECYVLCTLCYVLWDMSYLLCVMCVMCVVTGGCGCRCASGERRRARGDQRVHRHDLDQPGGTHQPNPT